MSRTGAVAVVFVLLISARGTRADPSEEDCLASEGVVGRRECPPYGMWGLGLEDPYMAVSFGVNMRVLPREPVAAPVLARGASPTPGASSSGSDTSYSLFEQVTVAHSQHLYGGLELEVSPTLPPAGAVGARTFGAGSSLLLGLQGGSQTVKLAAELAGGVRIIDSADDEGLEPVLEARARGDLWLTPWATVGVVVGTSLLDRREWMTGIFLAAHTYAFGGM